MNVKEKIDALVIEKRSFINGNHYETEHGLIINKTSPVDGRDLSGLSSSQNEDVDFAVQTAKNAFNSKIWSHKSTVEKKKVIYKLASLIESNLEELALLDTLETGRAYNNYYHDSIPKAIEVLRYFAESVDKCYDFSISPSPSSFANISRQPLGVIGLITPWNDPLVVALWKIAPALLMGNSVVIKPAEESSFSILKVASLAKQAGLPDGVLNVISGIGEVAGKALAMHSDVAGIYFTGSSDVGKKILTYAGQSNMKKVGLECGGKSPFIISKKCNNLSAAVKVLAKSMFYNQGQICSAPSRAIVDESLLDEFIEVLLEEYIKYIPKDPYDIDSIVGCVVSEKQKLRIQKYIDIGVESGAKLFSPKEINTMDSMSQYVMPTVFIADSKAIIAQEEIFGPVLVVLPFGTMNDALEMANDTKYGLAASIWTNDINEAHWFSSELNAGIVHVNSYGDDDNSVPFGGVKQSGIGKDKSIFAFDEYSYQKTTWTHFD